MKRAVAIVLIIVLSVSLTGCGTNYEKLGYDAAKAFCANIDTVGTSERTVEEYRALMGLTIALLGRSEAKASMAARIAESSAGSEIDVPEDKVDDFNAGIERAVDDWLAQFD